MDEKDLHRDDDSAMAAVRLLLEIREMDKQEMQEARRSAKSARRCAMICALSAILCAAAAVASIITQ